MSSDDEANEEVSRTLDEAFQLCGRFIPTDTFRLTHVCGFTRSIDFFVFYVTIKRTRFGWW